MILKIRNSGFLRVICLFMTISILAISCDPNGDLVNNYRMDKEIEKQLAVMSSQYSTEECNQARKVLQRGKRYVQSRSKLGLVSRADVLGHLIDEGIRNGEIKNVSQKERDKVVETFSNDAFALNSNSLDPVYGHLKNDGRITEYEQDYLVTLEDRVERASSTQEAISIFNKVRSEMKNNQKMTESFKQALNLGFDQAELAICAAAAEGDLRMSEDGTSSRCEIWTCVTEYTWQIQVIMVVIAIVAIVLAIFTFGFSLLLVTVTFAAWVLVPVVVCAFLPCPEEDCPNGEALTCQNNFVLNADNLCFAEGFKVVGDALYSDPTSGTNCPPGAIYTGSLTGCFHGLMTDGIFGDLQEGEDYWADETGAYHLPVCN